MYRILCLGPSPCSRMNLAKSVSPSFCGSLLKMTRKANTLRIFSITALSIPVRVLSRQDAGDTKSE